MDKMIEALGSAEVVASLLTAALTYQETVREILARVVEQEQEQLLLSSPYKILTQPTPTPLPTPTPEQEKARTETAARELEEMKVRVLECLRVPGNKYFDAEALAQAATHGFFPIAVASDAVAALLCEKKIDLWRVAGFAEVTPATPPVSPIDLRKQAICNLLHRCAMRANRLYHISGVSVLCADFHDVDEALDALVADGTVVKNQGGWYRLAKKKA
ncbi:MAG: hypothetical protein M0R22_00350 [Dehalococcoidia bacterium]|jgi:hypothetical protein|nr:hypothetical protein [Dehalococcoidia bacterium]